MKLDLEAKTKEKELVKTYLEENASEVWQRKSTAEHVSEKTAKR